jgi:hypothetical protein
MISSPTCLQETPLHAKENCARAWEILGDHRIQQTRSDTTLHDQAAEGRSGGERSVVVEGISVAGHLGEHRDVAHTCPSRALGKAADVPLDRPRPWCDGNSGGR